MLVKGAPQLLQHRFMLRMSRSRSIRRRQQSSFEALVIELLPHHEHALLVWHRIEELIHCIGSTLMPNVFVFCAKCQQQFLVVSQKRRSIDLPFVPQQHEPSPALVSSQTPVALAADRTSARPVLQLQSQHWHPKVKSLPHSRLRCGSCRILPAAAHPPVACPRSARWRKQYSRSPADCASKSLCRKLHPRLCFSKLVRTRSSEHRAPRADIPADSERSSRPDRKSGL